MSANQGPFSPGTLLRLLVCFIDVLSRTCLNLPLETPLKAPLLLMWDLVSLPDSAHSGLEIELAQLVELVGYPIQ